LRKGAADIRREGLAISSSRTESPRGGFRGATGPSADGRSGAWATPISGAAQKAAGTKKRLKRTSRIFARQGKARPLRAAFRVFSMRDFRSGLTSQPSGRRGGGIYPLHSLQTIELRFILLCANSGRVFECSRPDPVEVVNGPDT